MGEVIKCSKAFKRKLVENVAAGKYRSIDGARRRNEIDELKASKKRIRELEAAPPAAPRISSSASAFTSKSLKTTGF
jgi:hypothetical protein